MIKGIAASEGIGIGKVMLVEETSLEYTPKIVTEPEEESQRYSKALNVFCNNTKVQAELLKQSAGESESEILLGHIQMAKDPYLCSEIEKMISDGMCAEAALEHMCDMFIGMFSATDDELTKQRATDILDIKNGILSILLGVDEVSISNAPKGTVIVAKELTPSMTSGINKNNIVGIITEKGGKTSHSAILARALEIPAVLSVENAVNLFLAGTDVIVDGIDGTVISLPTDEETEKYSKIRTNYIEKRKTLEQFKNKKTVSKDNIKYELFSNIGKPDDAILAVDATAEGVGLFRTEFLFMNRTAIPNEEEQFSAYKKAALTLKGKPLIIRTLDIGGDKDIPYMNLTKEENPFMGFRAIRYCLKNQDIFKTQLRAILRASAFGNIQIMFPLITTVDEIRQAKKILKVVMGDLTINDIPFNKNIKIGIMIETASAAVISDILAKECDFFSIGTNDLTGYTMSCDRGNSDVSYLYSVFQPSVLRLIKTIIKSGESNGISVGMCGEAAANELLIPLLISFGLNEFSVSPSSVLKVRKIISCYTKETADELANKVMTMDSQNDILNYLNECINK